MEYKRLKNNLAILEEYNKTHRPVFHITYGQTHEVDLINEIISDSKDLLDKIENGTLLSIPFIRKHPKVENAFMVVYETEHGDLQGQMFCGENAEEEAKKFLEQKLKELKEV